MRRSIAPFLATLLLTATCASAQQLKPEIWFNPHGPGVDLAQMWTQDAPWQDAAAKVQVLVLVHWWVRAQSDATLLQIRDFAKQHHMKIDLSTEPIAKFPSHVCGNEEGYMEVADINATVQILKRLDFQVDWVDMDGTLQAGHYDTYPSGCQLAIPDLVNQVALILNPIVAAWPLIKIMEIEPLVLTTNFPTWRQDETAFHIGLAQAIGRHVQSMQSDVEWQLPGWKQAMLDVYQYTRQQNLAYSVIYDAITTADSDANWISSVVKNIEAVEGELHIIPEQVLFTSWSQYPLYNMPDTSPTAQTWLINRYPRPRSGLQAQFVGLGLRGKLTTINGKPIANATVNGFKPGVDFAKPLPVTVVHGTVPADAVRALIGVRINVECGCDGINDVLFGGLGYQETSGGSSGYVYNFTKASQKIQGAVLGGETIGGTLVNRVIALPGQGVVLNSDPFPVTANAQFQFTVPAATVAGAGWYGNITLIFVDAAGNGTRVNVVPDPGKALMATGVTAADGTFIFRVMPRGVYGHSPVTVEFDGAGGTYRSTVWTPLR